MKRFRSSFLVFAFILIRFHRLHSLAIFISFFSYFNFIFKSRFGGGKYRLSCLYVCLWATIFFLFSSPAHNSQSQHDMRIAEEWDDDDEMFACFHYTEICSICYPHSSWTRLHSCAFYASSCTMSLPHVIHYDFSSLIECRSMVEGQTCTREKTYQLIAYFSYLPARLQQLQQHTKASEKCFSAFHECVAGCQQRLVSARNMKIFFSQFLHAIIVHSLSYSSVCVCCEGGKEAKNTWKKWHQNKSSYGNFLRRNKFSFASYINFHLLLFHCFAILHGHDTLNNNSGQSICIHKKIWILQD